MNDTCICDNVPKVWRLTGVTRTLRLRIFNPDGTPLDLTGRTVAVTIARDNSEFVYAPGFVIEGDDNNVVKFEWPANQQWAGDYTINVTTTDGSGNVDRVNWHGPTGIRLVDFSFMVRGEDALGVTSEANIGLDGTFTMNGTGMSAYDEWLAEGHTGTPEDFIAWLRQPAVDAASAAEAQMGQIQERADADHTRAGNDHTTAGQDHTRAGNDHTTATDDHRIAAADHSTATDDHTLATSDHGTAAEDHRVAGIDHGTAADDHTRAGQDHATASDDHTQAGSDHTRAGEDHTRAGDDHQTASSDHTRAGEDHTTAGGDHTRAGEDHTQAGNDHTRAEADHGIAADDHTQATADHAVMAGYDTRLGNVETEVSQLGQYLYNKIPFTSEIGAISATTGTEQATPTSRKRTDFVDISGISSIIYARVYTTSSSSTGLGLAFYDGEKNYIQGSGVGEEFGKPSVGYSLYKVIVPEGAVYARFTYWADEKRGLFFFCDGDKDAIAKWYSDIDGDIAQSGLLKASIFSLGNAPMYPGSLESTKIFSDGQAKYIVLMVGGGEKLHMVGAMCRIMILSDFTFNPTLPYTPSSWATGESGRRQSTSGLDVTLPSDAKYILVQYVLANGTICSFSEFTIDGLDCQKFLSENVAGVLARTGVLEGTVAELVSSEEKTLDDVEITTQIDIDDIPDVVAQTGTSVEPNPQNGANFSTNANYDSYYFYTSKQMTAWVVDNGTAYIAITVVEGAGAFSNNIIPGTSSYRKRKSESNLPTQQNPLIIPAGSAVIFTATKQKVFPFAYLDSYSEFNGDTPLAPEHIEQVKDEIGGLMYCSKSASAVDIYFRISGEKYIHYPFEKRYKDYTSGQYPSFYDNWGIGKVALSSFATGALINDAYLFEEGEAELAVSVVSGQDTNKYVGGKAHGFENIVVNDSERDITILIDNQRVAEDGVVSLKEVSKVEILQHTLLFQAYTNTDPFADITKHWVFEDGKMVCTTTLKVIRALTFNYTQFGMMCVLRRWDASTSNPYLTSRAIKENLPYKSWEVEDGWSSGLSSPDSSCRRIIEYGEKGLGFSMAITTETLKTGGGMFVSTNNQAYNKIYFDMARNYTPSVNDVLEATQTWEIF